MTSNLFVTSRPNTDISELSLTVKTPKAPRTVMSCPLSRMKPTAVWTVIEPTCPPIPAR